MQQNYSKKQRNFVILVSRSQGRIYDFVSRRGKRFFSPYRPGQMSVTSDPRPRDAEREMANVGR